MLFMKPQHKWSHSSALISDDRILQESWCLTAQPTYKHRLVICSLYIHTCYWVCVCVLAGVMALKEKDSCIWCVKAGRCMWCTRASVYLNVTHCAGWGEVLPDTHTVSHLGEDSLWVPFSMTESWVKKSSTQHWEQCVWQLTSSPVKLLCATPTLRKKKNLFGLNRFFFVPGIWMDTSGIIYLFFFTGHSYCCHLWWSGWEWP